MDTWSIGKNEPKRTQNEPKTNPNEPKSKKAKMNVTAALTKGYENMTNWAICENEPKRTQYLPAISVAGQSQYMLPRKKINTRRKSLAYDTDGDIDRLVNLASQGLTTRGAVRKLQRLRTMVID
ncbi:MAG: hypothetical protein ACYTDW_12875 [Planctomycetota bacterium]